MRGPAGVAVRVVGLFPGLSRTTRPSDGTASAGEAGSFLPPAVRNAVASVPEPIVDLIVVAALLAVGWYGSKLVVRLTGRTVARRIKRPSVTRTVLRAVRTAVLILAVFAAATRLGFRPGDILLSVTVFSAALGIVLAPIAGSIINGLFVLADQPYEIGDMIEIVDTGRRGYVEDITIRYTKIFTLDNTFIVIPNSSIRDRDVINYSAEDERTRQSLELVVTYEGDLDRAREIMESAATEVEAVITGGPDIRIGAARYPAAPTAYVAEYGDHGVRLLLRYWVKQPYKLTTVRSRVNERVWERLEATDVVEIAYPHQHLIFDETSGTASVSVDGDAGGPRGPSGVGANGPDGADRRSENDG